MNSLFSLDNPVMRFLTKLFDVMFLSILWFVFSIPIITIGASTTAMYYATVKVIRRDRGYIFKEFLKSFKLNFLQATLSWIIIVAGALLFFFNVKFALTLQGKAGTLLTVVYGFMGILVLGCGMYIFPVLSRFTMKFSQLIKTSVFLFFKYIPRSVLMAVIVFAAVALMYISQLAVFFLPVGATLLFSLIMEPTLKIYTPHAEGEEEKKDEWYLE
ncbi:MAG TPA: hypothetical protein DCW90_08915 [Lachnospiraceae bacterium]|nr:DUF624 domain-containing protein [uncultured Lachnoclostridium sp.]HAU85606.1 hypothetical protein [Lachnospiraceae bacterium]